MRVPVLLLALPIAVAAIGCGSKDSHVPGSGLVRPGSSRGWSGVKQWGTGGADAEAIGVGVATDGPVWVASSEADVSGSAASFTVRRFTPSGAVDLDEALPAHTSRGSFAFAAGVGTPVLGGPDTFDTSAAIGLDPAGAVRWRAIVPGAGPFGPMGLAAAADGTTYVGLVSMGQGVGGGDGLSKVAPDGTLLWTTAVTGVDGPAVAADGAQVYAAADLPVEYTADGHTSRFDVALTRLTTGGDVVWVRQLDDPKATLSVTALAVTSDGGVVAAGHAEPPYFSASAAGGGADSFVARWDADGKLVWRTPIASGAASSTFAAAIVVATDGSIAVAGTTTGLAGQPSIGGLDGFVARLDAAGVIGWTRVLGTPADDQAWGVAFDAASDVYVCGGTSGAFPGSASAGTSDAFLARFTPDGELQ